MKSYQPTFTAGLFTAATIFAAVLLAPMNAAEAGPRGMSGRDWRVAEVNALGKTENAKVPATRAFPFSRCPVPRPSPCAMQNTEALA